MSDPDELYTADRARNLITSLIVLLKPLSCTKQQSFCLPDFGLRYTNTITSHAPQRGLPSVHHLLRALPLSLEWVSGC